MLDENSILGFGFFENNLIDIEKDNLYQEDFTISNNYELRINENPNVSTKPTEGIIVSSKKVNSQQECENNLDENNFTQKKTEREEEKKPRKDNIFKQIKVKGLKFFIDTMNHHMNKINRFYNFKNNFIREVKERLKKDYNLSLLQTTMEDIFINYSDKDFNKKVINFVNDNLKTKIDNENLIFIHNFLKMKFIDIIKIYALSNEQYYNKFGYDNKFLLEKSTIPNKDDMKNLIEFGLIEYLNEKIERNSQKKG